MSTDHHDTGERPRVLRDVATLPLAELLDVDALTGDARRAVDPAGFTAREAEGYEAGRLAGYRDGHAAGIEEARAAAAAAAADVAADADRALGALSGAARQVQEWVTAEVAGFERAVVDAAVELACAMVGHDVAASVDPGRDAIERALRLVDGPHAVVARLHPDDVAALGDVAHLAPGRDMSVVADPAVERGGCILDLGDGRIDARLSTAVERVRTELLERLP